MEEQVINAKTGDILFFRTGSFIARMIQKIAGLNYNHVGVIANWGDKPMVIEAVGKGIETTPLAVRLAESNKVKLVRSDNHVNLKRFIRESTDFLGHTNYDYWGLLFHQAVWNLSCFTIWIGAKSAAKAVESFYCYEFVNYLFRHEFKQWWKCKPKQLQNATWHSDIFEGSAEKLKNLLNL